mgnify:CR=1 FL=1
MNTKIILKSNGCNVVLYEDIIKDTGNLYKNIFDKTSWRKDTITLFGKKLLIPRYQSWYGDSGCNYKYSNILLEPEKWFKELFDLKVIVENFTKHSFNCALVNLYEKGSDYSAWHSDDEKELGINPVIASISLGETRRFHLRNKKTKETLRFDLKDGSLLLMSGKTQHLYSHQLAKTAKIVDPRINITYRKIIK